MSNQILLKRSATPSKVPLTTDLALGELSVNTYDGTVFLKKDNGTPAIVQIGGTVVHPVKQVISGDVPSTSGTNSIPYDNSPPLNTEGALLLTINITPSSTASKIGIQLNSIWESSANSRILIASVFRNGTLVGVSPNWVANSAFPSNLNITMTDSPATTGAIAYTIRVGMNNTGTWKINKNDGTNGSFGGALLAKNGYVVMEY